MASTRRWCSRGLLVLVLLLALTGAQSFIDRRRPANGARRLLKLPEGDTRHNALYEEKFVTYCNSTGPCTICAKENADQQPCKQTGYRQAVVCTLENPSQSHAAVKHEFKHSSTIDEVRNYGAHREFSHVSCLAASSQLMPLGHFELIMLGVTVASMSVMAWRKRVLSRL
mmetsp:Transcript_2537/g.7215  ORF Transcript_2537/g.7215 Transcript_2537/m.7215 type:complete len:170 (-) Transcript_2537:132-641(-)|eukprot:CAMPEP_0117681052 /NCGR_PEP_ID=MMETSP0804-20121206/18734_1 /TAXON_ID=1074897 /ORGANISM="Tetraselmis astigmatica, Strain CCMP880" /LENGTH=169 /DNA_ID=CAMNT_0005490699 /DNA_START=110 /DNA_END=619 /DNA_ORIENTATION=+